nr:helix-turn-helix transcriptional regulator [uncultured Ruminococcus sp.]
MNYPKITLKAARVNAGLSQKEAAQKLNISRDTLSNYEKGIFSPSWDMVHKIGDLYDFPIDFIFFGS